MIHYASQPITTLTDNITMEAWVKADTISSTNTNIRVMYNGRSDQDGYGIYLHGPNKNPSILLGGVAFLDMATPETINTGAWYHLAAVRVNGVWKLYINGVEKALNNNTLSPYTPTTGFSVGNNNVVNVTETFNGSVDEVRFWTVARTAQQIQDTMYVKLGGNETGLLSYYNFDQYTAGGDNTGVTTVTDLAGHQNLSISGFDLKGDTSNFIQSVQLGQFQFESATYDVQEDAGTVRVLITRTGGSEGSVTLNYSTSDGTAFAGTNYTRTNGSVTFNDGEISKEIDIPIINNGILETKSFNMSLSAPSGVTIGTNSTLINIQPIAPSITTQPSDATVNAGSNTSYTVAATGTGLTYQWQVDTGSGFTNISNGGVYSGATTSTMSITGATFSMNGYKFRVVVSGSVSPEATSSSATLNVSPVSPPTLTADSTNNDTTHVIDLSFTDDTTWRGAITAVKDGNTTLQPTDYTFIAGQISINAGVLNAGSHTITVVATGYTDATVRQTVNQASITNFTNTSKTGTTATFTWTAASGARASPLSSLQPEQIHGQRRRQEPSIQRIQQRR